MKANHFSLYAILDKKEGILKRAPFRWHEEGDKFEPKLRKKDKSKSKGNSDYPTKGFTQTKKGGVFKQPKNINSAQGSKLQKFN